MSTRAQLMNDSELALRIALDSRQSSIWTAMPCIVQSVDLNKMTIEAQPAIQGTIENEQGVLSNVNYPLLVDVPIVFPSAGGFTITFPIAQGDEVLVIIASRCIDAWWQSGGIQRAMEARMHDLSDGFAIPGPRSQPNVVPAISATNLQIRNDAGTSYIEIDNTGKIKLVASAVEITGNLSVSGTIIGNAATVPVSVTTHVHGGVTTGPGTTAGPT